MQSTDVFGGWWYILLVEVKRCESEAGGDAAYETIAVRGEDELYDWSAIRRCAT